jgi:alanine racemase
MKTWVEISKKDILHNIKSLKSLLRPETLFMAVVKSNGYGHGLKEVSEICSSLQSPKEAKGDVQKPLIDWFGVDNIDEALALRKLGMKQPILILGYVPFDRIADAVENNISFVAYNLELLDCIKSLPASLFQREGHRVKIHIKVETGTARQGIEGKDLLAFIKKAIQNKNIFIEGAYTHYANIEDTSDPSFAINQLKKFNKNVAAAEKIIQNSKLIRHSACSAAIINYPEAHFNVVRAGISLYGMWPSNEAKLVAKQKNISLSLKPALTWKTQIAQIKKIAAGTAVSYGLTETVKRNSIIGILPVGYWDGYDRGLSGIGEVLINGRRAKILGRICMNMMVVDLTDIPKTKLFDTAILLGKSGKDEITAEELAKKINTINYEITTRINPLIKRIIS